MEALKQNHKKLILPKRAKKLIILLVFMLCFDFALFFMPVLASAATEEVIINQEVVTVDNEITEHLPQNNDLAVKNTSLRVITAYNSEPGQTDSTPCITANNFNLCEHGIEDSIAANFLPFGAKVRIPDLFGDRVFIVRDRMHSRFSNRVDVWMLEKADAINLGIKSTKIEILE